MGDLGCFSISCYKIIGGGEGGLLLSRDRRMFERACQVVESGGLYRPDRFAPARYPGELFCGTNYRMSELEAAVHVVQLQKMPALVRRYNTIKRSILSQLKTYREISPQKLNDPEGEVGATLRFFPQSIALGKKIAAALNAEGVGCGRFIFPSQCAVRDERAAPDWHVYWNMFPVLDQSRAAAPTAARSPASAIGKRAGTRSTARAIVPWPTTCSIATSWFGSIPVTTKRTARRCRGNEQSIRRLLYGRR